MARSARAHTGGRKAGRGRARHRRADARRNARDRSLQPPLRRGRRPLPDRHDRHQARHRSAGELAGHVHPRRGNSSPTVTPIRCRSGAIIAYARAASEHLAAPRCWSCGSARVDHEPHRRRHRACRQRPGFDFRRSIRRVPRQRRRAGRDFQRRAGTRRPKRRAHRQSTREPGEPGAAAGIRAAVHEQPDLLRRRAPGCARCRAMSSP